MIAGYDKRAMAEIIDKLHFASSIEVIKSSESLYEKKLRQQQSSNIDNLIRSSHPRRRAPQETGS